jgi:osmotically-inducible protein OsmY
MMRTITKAVAIAAISSTLLVGPAAFGASPEPVNLTQQFLTAGAVVDSLQVYEIAGVVIIRGRTASKAQAEEIGRLAQSLGHSRVANLIQITQHNDVRIAREAEVELANHRSLDGCRFNVSSAQGIVRLGGLVSHELQKDVALALLRQIDGVRAVEVDLKRF